MLVTFAVIPFALTSPAYAQPGADCGAPAETGQIEQVACPAAVALAPSHSPPLASERFEPTDEPQRSDLMHQDAYSTFRSVIPTVAGEIPALVQRPHDEHVWAFEPWGSPDAARRASRTTERVTSIATSDDGREAWAVGPGFAEGRLTLYHFDDGAWRRCDPGSIGAADRPMSAACADLRDLAAQGLILEWATTVDSGGGHFEAVAVGWLPAPAGASVYAVTAVILRYRGGRWTRDSVPHDPEVGLQYQLKSVVAERSGEGWAYGRSAADARDAVILRYRDGRWAPCSNSSGCDPAGLLPDRRFRPPTRGSALAAVGDRVFLAGSRIVTNGRLPEKHYPVVLSTDGGGWESSYGLDPAGPGRTPGLEDEGRITSFAVTAADAEDGLAGWARMSPPDGGPSTVTLRLSSTGRWERWSPDARGDALRDHPSGGELSPAAASNDAESQFFMTTDDGPLLRFDAAQGRWRVLPAPFDPSGANPFTAAGVQALAPDRLGGLWVVQDGGAKGPFLHRYANRRHRPVFDDVAHPLIGDRIRGVAAGPDGSLWIAGEQGRLARYDRIAGWRVVTIPEWSRGDGSGGTDIGAVAMGVDGAGIAVGHGRIANLTSAGATVDESWCQRDGDRSCRTRLRAADVAPDGSAIVGGDDGVLAWRPPGGAFQEVDPPPLEDGENVTGVALPTADRAWITTSSGNVFAARLIGERWRWDPSPENADAGDRRPLRAIALSPHGGGLAVGDGGTLLERGAGESGSWRRIGLGISDDFTAVALPEGGGGAALVGAEGGAIWTRRDGRFSLARPGASVDRHTAYGGSRVSGLAVLPGLQTGQVEAWAALDGADLGGVLLHHSSDPQEPLLTPVNRATPLRDTPPPRPGEVSFMAFGKSDCANPSVEPCPGPSGTDALSDIVSREIVERAAAARRRGEAPSFAVFTGDASDHGGELTKISRPALLNEWVDVVAHPLDRLGVPLLKAIGVLDLSESARCVERNLGVCISSEQATHAGANFFWRQAMALRVGQGDAPQTFAGVRYRPVHDDLAPPTPDIELPQRSADPAPSTVPTGGARTHYAVDAWRGSRLLVRLVFVDNSLGSLRASDPLQQPPEPRGQLVWLDRVLASRPRGTPAVVVSTSPSYTYRPRAATDAADDGASFEEIILKHQVSAVVSGRLGWNGLYYTLAPGVHCPAPGGAYPEHAPARDGGCGRDSGLLVQTPAASVRGAVPFVVSSSAGGKLAQESGEGYWHGYAVVRIDASGDPSKTIVEQRPILDWIVLTARRQRLLPGQTVTLNGVGREPLAADTATRYHRLTNHSITHRYELLLADPQRPWLPYRDDDGDYVLMSDRHPGCAVACIDRQTGRISSGKGIDKRIHALGHLSVGDLSATYPLVFEPRAVRESGRAAARHAGSLRPGGDAHRDLAGSPSPGAARPATSPTLDIPTFPGLPPPSAHAHLPQLPSEPSASSDPRPYRQASPVDLARGPPSSPDAPHVSPIPPSAPLAQPSPRVNAQQDKAEQGSATALVVGDDSPLAADEALEDQQSQIEVDLALDPLPLRGAEATRRTPLRPDLPMTALTSTEQPSAWPRHALYGGGLTLASCTLACGWLVLRRRPAAPSPAYSRSHPWPGSTR